MEKKEMMEIVDDAYDDASNMWTGCNWKHRWEEDEYYAGDIVEEPEDGWCEGYNDSCLYCQRVAGDSRDAEIEATKAIEAWHRGQYADAIKHIKESVSLEMNYGEAITWMSVLKAMEQALDTTIQNINKNK